MPFSLPVWLRSIGKRRDLMIGVPAVAVLLAALTAFVFYPAWKGGRHWQHAEQALAARDFAAASAQLRCYLEIHPTKAAAHFLQARTLRRASRFAEAESALDQARRLDWVPEQLELEETLARVQRHGAHGEDLHRLVGFVDARHPDERVILEAMAHGDRDALQFEQAARWLDLWIERSGDDWLPRWLRAEQLRAFAHFDQARAGDPFPARQRAQAPRQEG